MSVPGSHDDDDTGEVFLNEDDILHEIEVDDEELPDVDEEGEQGGSDEATFEDDYDGEDDSFHVFTGHTDEVFTVVCSPTDASLVATGGKDDRGFLWRIGQADGAIELKGHNESVSSLAFSHDGLLLASGSLDGAVKVWEIPSGNLKCTLEGPSGGIEWLRWHPRGHILLAGAGSEDSTIWMWNADRDAFLMMFAGHASSVTCGDFTPDGKTICSGSEDATLRVWNPHTGEAVQVVKGHPYHTEGLTCMAIKSANGSTLALTGSEDGSVHVVNIDTGRVVTSFNSHLDPDHPDTAHSNSVECLGFAPSSHWAATGGMDQKLIIWDLDHSVPRSICEHPEGVTCLTWLNSTRYVATGCVDGKIRIWDSLSGQCSKTFMGHSAPIQLISATVDGEYIVSSSLDGTARVFEIREFE